MEDKILELFFKEPEKEFYVREISRILKKSPTTISKHLKNLEKKKLLIKENKFNHLLFKANNEDLRFKNTKLNYNLEIIRESGIIDYLSEEFNNPEAIILFGSYAKGENIRKSDIDLLVISPLKKDVKLEKFEKKLGKMQLFVESRKDITKMKKTNKELLNSFINGKILYGRWEAF